MLDSPLAVFRDRNTLVYEREYPHPIERVWEAVSTGEHLDVWMLPESRVERRLGGSCAFGWGSPADDPAATRGTITVWTPPTAVQYSFDGSSAIKGDESFMRFDLAPVGESSTRLLFTLHFLPAPDEADQEWPGGDLPAPGTAWRPGFCAGYHGMLDELAPFLRGEWTADDRAASLAAGGDGPDDARLIERYRAQIRDTCPPA